MLSVADTISRLLLKLNHLRLVLEHYTHVERTVIDKRERS